jgi:hypothetical protein
MAICVPEPRVLGATLARGADGVSEQEGTLSGWGSTQAYAAMALYLMSYDFGRIHKNFSIA